jgi:DNA-binding phage protein
VVTSGPGRWEQIRARKLAGPDVQARYERTRRSVSSIRQLLQLIDAERRRAGLTKAELAERTGASPAAIRRLLTSDGSNATLRTILDLLDALDIELALRPRACG